MCIMEYLFKQMTDMEFFEEYVKQNFITCTDPNQVFMGIFENKKRNFIGDTTAHGGAPADFENQAIYETRTYAPQTKWQSNNNILRYHMHAGAFYFVHNGRGWEFRGFVHPGHCKEEHGQLGSSFRMYVVRNIPGLPTTGEMLPTKAEWRERLQLTGGYKHTPGVPLGPGIVKLCRTPNCTLHTNYCSQ